MKSEGVYQTVKINGEWKSNWNDPNNQLDDFEGHKMNLFHELFCHTEQYGFLSDYNTIPDGQRLVISHFGKEIGTKFINARKEIK